MGYYCNSIDSSFYVKKENVPKMINAYISKFHIASPPTKNQAETEKFLVNMFQINGMEITYDKSDNIDCVWYEYGKLHSDLEDFLDTIAPYVEDLSYITLIGEDSSIWQYVFHDGKMDEYDAVITFPGSPLEKQD